MFRLLQNVLLFLNVKYDGQPDHFVLLLKYHLYDSSQGVSPLDLFKNHRRLQIFALFGLKVRHDIVHPVFREHDEAALPLVELTLFLDEGVEHVLVRSVY